MTTIIVTFRGGGNILLMKMPCKAVETVCPPKMYVKNFTNLWSPHNIILKWHESSRQQLIAIMFLCAWGLWRDKKGLLFKLLIANSNHANVWSFIDLITSTSNFFDATGFIACSYNAKNDKLEWFSCQKFVTFSCTKENDKLKLVTFSNFSPFNYSYW